MKQDFSQDLTVTSKGQLTLPVAVRRKWKLGTNRKIRMEVSEEGVVTMRPLPDVMSFFGAARNDKPYDPQEKAKSRAAIGRDRKG